MSRVGRRVAARSGRPLGADARSGRSPADASSAARELRLVRRRPAARPGCHVRAAPVRRRRSSRACRARAARSRARCVARPQPAVSIRRGSATLRARPSSVCGHFLDYAEHQAAEEARPDRRRRAAREPALPLDDQDADEAARRRPSPRATRTRSRPSTRISCKLIDRAVARGALHRNAGARKKSQAARARRRPPRPSRLPRQLPRSQRRSVISTSARSSSSSPASREPPLSAWSSSASRTVRRRARAR